LNATDIYGIDKYWIDDTNNFSINGDTGEITNATALIVGNYLLEISVNNTDGE